MDTNSEEGQGGPKIDIRTLPESVSLLWESMLRKNPNWDLAKWLDDRANEELELLESHLGRERLRYEQRLHRIENLSKQMKRRRESIGGTTVSDPNQRNLFDVYGPSNIVEEPGNLDQEMGPLVDFGTLSTGDDLLLAYISQKVLIAIEDSNRGREGLHIDDIIQLLESPGINTEDIDEAISWLLQKKEITEIERDVFVIDG
ncbi:MAG TPA: hypothetical protein EYQ11_03185 [Candidatus Poseidoniales archaeon]|jgi:hypothetical protein|nr:MAG: hypothetical protein CXT66_05605 [Euryarchaeota archaeon]HIG33869.1 hypothetical protein [Candidatus Poseidoniales archaeon]HIL67299.1 hypothetical protein [Candidatus Poseidoniales archaeon]